MVPIPMRGKASYLKGWSALEVTPEVIQGWETEFPTHKTTGVRCGGFVAGLDLDLDDPATCAAIAQEVERRWHAPARSSGGERRAYLLRVETPQSKQALVFTRGEEEAKIEVQGERCLLGVWGPKARGKEYGWDRLPWQEPLPLATGLDEFLAEATALMKAHGWVPKDYAAGAGGPVQHDILPHMVFSGMSVEALKDACRESDVVRVCMAALRPGATNPMTGAASVREDGSLFIYDYATQVTHLEPSQVEEGLEALAEAMKEAGWKPEAAPRAKLSEAQYLCSDLCNAQRIRRSYRDAFFYFGGWHVWDGKHWAADPHKLSLILSTLSSIIKRELVVLRQEEVPEDRQEAHDALVKKLSKWGEHSECDKGMAAAERLLRNEAVVRGETLNSDPWALNCANGTVDLRTGAIRAHRKADYITTCVPVDYVPGAKSPLWEATLRDIYTPDVIPFVQEWFGYCMTGSVREQKFVAHWGGGDNGKSTVIDIIMGIAGPLGLTASADLFTQRRFGSSETSVMAATLFGKRIAVAHETDATASLREALIKQLTGGDKIAGRRLYQDAFDFTPTHSLNLITNHPPQIQGTDNGIWRRVVLLPYLSRFGDAQDVAEGRATHLKDPMRMERLKGEREGILAWLVEGARRWCERGYLEVPAAVKSASQQYREGEDRIGEFCREHVARVPGAKFTVSGYIPAGETNAYQFYRGWCADAGYLPLSAGKFRAEMLTRAPYPKWERNSNHGLYLEGLKLVNWQNVPTPAEELAGLM